MAVAEQRPQAVPSHPEHSSRDRQRDQPAEREAASARRRPRVCCSRSRIVGTAKTAGKPHGSITIEAPMPSAITIASATAGPL